jgi:RHS repeat-associated protein
LQGDLNPDVGYAGMYYHAASGLNLTLFRAYDSDLGRWLSIDPIGEFGGLNLYAYVANNPINAVDFFGLSECSDLANVITRIEHITQGAINSLGNLNKQFEHANYLQDLQLVADLADLLDVTSIPFELEENAEKLAYRGTARVGGKIWKKQVAKATKLINEENDKVVGDALALDALPQLVAQVNGTVDAVLSPASTAAESIVEMASETSESTYEIIKEMQKELSHMIEEYDANCCSKK